MIIITMILIIPIIGRRTDALAAFSQRLGYCNYVCVYIYIYIYVYMYILCLVIVRVIVTVMYLYNVATLYVL